MITSPIRRTRPLVAAVQVVLLAFSAGVAGPALADCGASNTPAKARASWSRGQQLENAGRSREALAAYVAAQETTCEANPVELDAARRAASLAKPLAATAERQGDLALAYELYESGGLFADADRVLLANVRARADDVALWERSRSHFSGRALPAFQANEKVRLGVTGAYAADPAALAEVLAMPAKRHAAALARENTAFDEKYLEQRVTFARSLPDDPTDAAAVARLQQQAQALARQWPKDPLETSQHLLTLARDWSNRVPEAQSKALEAQTRARYEQRATTLATKYAGAPQALAAAMDYQRAAAFGDAAIVEPRVAKLRAQALELGRNAEQGGKLELAAQYYDVAGDDARVAAVREKQRSLAMAKYQPQIDDAKRAAEALAKQYGDPAQVEALRRQAEAAKAAIREQQAQGRKNQAGNDEFAKELGL